MRICFHGILTGSLVVICCVMARAADAPPATTQPASDPQELAAAFESTLTNAQFVGHFTVDGDPRPPKEDRYTIVSAKHLKGETWVLTARIQYGQRDLTVPLWIPVKWAGDTPMLSITDMHIPGMGTYTARVLIYRDHYAGTWSAGPNHGGTLAGRIEHTAATQPAASTPASGASEKK